MTVEPIDTPETWGCTVEDVKRRLLHISFEAPVATDLDDPYFQNAPRGQSDDDIQEAIYDAASDVTARIIRYDQVPERTQSHLRTMARRVVADGAAHILITAAFPAGAAPNDGDAYADRLWQRFQTRLDAMGGVLDDAIETGPSTGTTWASITAPQALFTDVEVY